MTTQVQIGLLHHALGVSVHQRRPYQNRFVAGPGHHDLEDLEALERAGLMERVRTPAFLAESDIVFVVTETGRLAALDALPPQPTPPKRTRLDEWRARDGSESFGEFLCGDRLPEFEWRTAARGQPAGRWGCEFRMFRCRYSHCEPEVRGEWKCTKKEARASYKAALKAFHARRKD